MKTYKNISPLILSVLIFILTGCDYERINTNQFEVTPEMGKMDGIALGAPFTAMQSAVALVGTQADATDLINQYQVAYHLSADTWSGYFGQNNNWNNGSNNTTYFLIEGWVEASFRGAYTNLLPLWKEIKMQSEELEMPEAFALAQILKVSAWHKATDMFGPIPYKHAGEPIIIVPYDSQEDVYYSFFEDLQEAVDVLTPIAEQNGKVLADYDAIYSGDTKKWVKYANSLMLRLAMRIRYAAPQKAREIAERVVSSPFGVMMDKGDEAKQEKGAGLVFVNNIEWLDQTYNESRMGSSIYSYLVGYNDPRLKKYFREFESQYAIPVPQGGKYQAIPTGHIYAQNDNFKAFSSSTFGRNTATYWMRASEIYFLRAEGAHIGWNMGGTAESLYKEGVAMSFMENDLDASLVEAYLTANLLTAEYALSLYDIYEDPPTLATTLWEGNDELKLEKIMVQKWLALFPNGQEAWSEWRRTGYPRLHEVQNNRSGGAVNPREGIRRMTYPRGASQSAEEVANLDKAIELLGGANSPSTKLWWDKK